MVSSILSKKALVALVDGRDWFIGAFSFSEDFMCLPCIARGAMASDLAESPCAIFILRLFSNEATHLIIHGKVLRLLITNLHPELVDETLET